MVLRRRLDLSPSRSWLLLGPRRVGKTTWLRERYPAAEYIDLLKSDVYFEYRTRPALLRERFSARRSTIVIDEIQRIPDLMSEVHWMLENTACRFVICGSSARKLRKQGVTNLAGRLRSAHMVPLTAAELDSFPLTDRLQYGCLPPVVLTDDPWGELKDYCGEYLREEVIQEGIVRNVPAFSRFLELAAVGNAELLSFATIARDAGVSAKTVASYYQILEDTLLGYQLPPWRRSRKRRAILTPKFYFFDCGVPNALLGRRLAAGTPEYGKAFEHLLVLETIAARFYGRRIEEVAYWRSASGYEVDLLLDGRIAVEFKAGRVHDSDCGGLTALGEEVRLQHRWMVCTETHSRRLSSGVEVLPWREYLQRLGGL